MTDQSRGRTVIVGVNTKFKVGDHDYWKSSLILDAIQIHSFLEKENDESDDIECKKENIWEKVSGKVFYRSIFTEGSYAVRGAVELSMAWYNTLVLTIYIVVYTYI